MAASALSQRLQPPVGAEVGCERAFKRAVVACPSISLRAAGRVDAQAATEDEHVD